MTRGLLLYLKADGKKGEEVTNQPQNPNWSKDTYFRNLREFFWMREGFRTGGKILPVLAFQMGNQTVQLPVDFLEVLILFEVADEIKAVVAVGVAGILGWVIVKFHSKAGNLG
ncbi:MAG: hypothetical protein O3B73_18465, partial [bacterium]|nr:hypothetical protein [bacterium]